MAFQLPDLPYGFDALEPHIDATTMQIHHGKHHQAYVNNLNAAIEKAPELAGKSLDDLIRGIRQRARISSHGRSQQRRRALESLDVLDLDGAQAGGEPEWRSRPRDQRARSADFDKFKEQFAAAGVGRFGSGWAWLVNDGGKLSITSTPNQDNPLMEGKSAPLLGLDVWEHAYYLQYQNAAGLHHGVVERRQLGSS